MVAVTLASGTEKNPSRSQCRLAASTHPLYESMRAVTAERGSVTKFR